MKGKLTLAGTRLVFCHTLSCPWISLCWIAENQQSHSGFLLPENGVPSLAVKAQRVLWQAEEVSELLICSGFNSSFLSIFTRPCTSCSFLSLEAEVLKSWDKLFLRFLEAGWNQKGQGFRRPSLSGFSVQETGLGAERLRISTPLAGLGSARPVKSLIVAAASLFNHR